MKRLIIVSTNYEVNPLLKHLNLAVVNNYVALTGSEDDNVLLISGVGTPSTIMELTRACSSASYDEIVQVGFCGSFDKTLPLGAVVEVVADCFADLGFDDRGSFLPLHIEMPDVKGSFGWMKNEAKTRLPFKRGVTVNTTSGSENRIQQIVETWNPDVETMEGAAALLFCIDNRIPYLQVRAVSNLVTPRNKSEWNMELAARNLSDWLKEYLNLAI